MHLEICDRVPFSIQDASLCPLFPPELIDLMYRLIPEEKQSQIGTAIVVRARLGSKEPLRERLASRAALKQ